MADKLKKYRVPRSAITEKGLKHLIRKATKNGLSTRDWAIEHGVTPQTISAFFAKTQGAGLKLPQVLGYRAQVIYLPLDEDPIQVAYPPRRLTKNPSLKVDHSKPPLEKKGLKQKDDRKETKKRLKKRKKA